MEKRSKHPKVQAVSRNFVGKTRVRRSGMQFQGHWV